MVEFNLNKQVYIVFPSLAPLSVGVLDSSWILLGVGFFVAIYIEYLCYLISSHWFDKYKGHIAWVNTLISIRQVSKQARTCSVSSYTGSAFIT